MALPRQRVTPSDGSPLPLMHVAPSVTGEGLKAQNRRKLITIFLVVLADLIGFGIIIPITPYLASEFGATAVDVGLLMTVFSLMQFLFAPIWGRLSDRVGRRPILLMSLAGSTLSYIAFAFAPNLFLLYLARIFAGIFGATVSTAMAYIADVTEAKARSKNMGLIGAAFGLGFILGPLLGGLFSELGGYLGASDHLRIAFPSLGAAAICALNFFAAFKVLPESRKAGAPQRKAMNRLASIWLNLKKPVLGVVFLMLFVNGLGMGSIEAMFFLFMKDIYGWSVKFSSYGFAYIGFMIAFTQGYMIRKLLPKFGERTAIVGGLLSAAVGMFLIGTSGSVLTVALGSTFLAMGTGTVGPALTGTLSLLSSEHEQGEVLGISHSFMSLARILGPMIGGLVYKEISPHSTFLLSSTFFLLSLGLFTVIAKSVTNAAKV